MASREMLWGLNDPATVHAMEERYILCQSGSDIHMLVQAFIKYRDTYFFTFILKGVNTQDFECSWPLRIQLVKNVFCSVLKHMRQKNSVQQFKIVKKQQHHLKCRFNKPRFSKRRGKWGRRMGIFRLFCCCFVIKDKQCIAVTDKGPHILSVT